jgi:hypothetical protein
MQLAGRTCTARAASAQCSRRARVPCQVCAAAAVVNFSSRSADRASLAQRASRAVVRAATEDKLDVAAGNGAAAGLEAPTNMLDFDELSDIIRWEPRTRGPAQGRLGGIT